MGCSSSTPVSEQDDANKPTEKATPPVTPNPSRQPSLGAVSTTSATNDKHDTTKLHPLFLETKTLTLANLGQVQYACLSKKGKDPEFPRKANQDAFGVVEKFNGDASNLLVGVYDGHGSTGDACSQFVRDKLPSIFGTALDQHFDLVLSTDQIQNSWTAAHVECNQQLHTSQIDDSTSGTTAITILLQGTEARLTLANVGDSRAVLGTLRGNKIQALPLSKDQTPKRQDEANRCIAQGARILSFGQMSSHNLTLKAPPGSSVHLGAAHGDGDEEDEDPPRVWAQDGKYPGTAFTRSLGDAVAEKLGVIAAPECLSLKLSQNEKFLILASDGIWDVLDNQQVCDICACHKSPYEACQALVEKAHCEWLRNEDCENDDDPGASYDDITLAVIYLNNVWDDLPLQHHVDGHNHPVPTTMTASTMERKKRVRQKTLRNLEDMG